MSTSAMKKVDLGEECVHLYLDGAAPVAEYRNQTISHLWILCNQCPCLSDPRHLCAFAEIANFLWKGESFKFIARIDEYQENYLRQVDCEKKIPSDVFPYRLTDYQIFDVSVMHKPRLMEDKLHYFVYNTSTGLPYRVVCPFPYTSTSTMVHYQVLPIMG